jgi:hypothetical protein
MQVLHICLNTAPVKASKEIEENVTGGTDSIHKASENVTGGTDSIHNASENVTGGTDSIHKASEYAIQSLDPRI